MKNLKKILISMVLVCSVCAIPTHAKADGAHEFLMSVTYGTLAGTLLGVASLAFTHDPGNKLQNVARGASLGLYAGIILGLYVVYAVPDENEELNKILPPEDGGQPQTHNRSHFPILYPMFSDAGEIDGAGMQITVWNF